MAKIKLRDSNRERRKLRIRKKISGTTDVPRLSVFRSNRFIYGQIIDDVKKKTLVSLSLADIKQLHDGKSKVDAAHEIGIALAKKAKEKKITSVVFDRNGYIYHGRVKNVAEGARKGGLNL